MVRAVLRMDRAVNADIIAQAALNADVARELLLEAQSAASYFDGYVFAQDLKRPNGTTLSQWRADTIELLLSDAAVRLERAVVLLGVQTSSTK